MDKDKYRSVVWLNLLKDFFISFCVGVVITHILKNEFEGVQAIYVCLLVFTLGSTVNIFVMMQDGVEEGIPFLPLSATHKTILFFTFMMGIASITIIPKALNGYDDPYSILFLLILLFIGNHYLSKWWKNRADELNRNRIQRYIKGENIQIQKIVDYLIAHASDELLFEVLKDKVRYDCIYDESYRIKDCKTLYLCDLGIDELREPLRLSAYRTECGVRYRSQKWG